MGIRKTGDKYVKTGGRRPAQVDLEAAGLRWLAEAMPSGGAHVVPVLAHRPGRLEIRAVPSRGCTPAAARAFGRALAVTHAAGAPYLGCAPAGWDGVGWMGNAHLIYARPDATNTSWGRLYGPQRILPNLAPARDNGSIDAAGARIIERLCARLDQGAYDHPQPGLVPGAAARIHGDLWSGNVIWAPTAALDWAGATAGLGPAGATRPAALPDVVGVLIDPAAQGGHAETDLADLQVFGQAHMDQIYAGYNEASPLAPGWRERIGLHQIHMLIVHANLFGGGYGAETVALARRYL